MFYVLPVSPCNCIFTVINPFLPVKTGQTMIMLVWMVVKNSQITTWKTLESKVSCYWEGVFKKVLGFFLPSVSLCYPLISHLEGAVNNSNRQPERRKMKENFQLWKWELSLSSFLISPAAIRKSSWKHGGVDKFLPGACVANSMVLAIHSPESILFFSFPPGLMTIYNT